MHEAQPVLGQAMEWCMSLITEFSEPGHSAPMEVVERFARDQDYEIEVDDGEIRFSIDTQNTSYHVAFTWIEESMSVHLACAFDLKIPPHRLREVERLILAVNLA